ncbi:hypothetical protein [Brevundimonas sp. TWP2-3-2]|uniref:hypothetical protein n=1 Tax=unclassified Brevundimonas TaxID=2622653 RepID=UPI003CF5C9C7
MSPVRKSISCPIHGEPRHRSTCKECNAAYMRGYLRRRTRERPSDAIWERARRRAMRLGVHFNLPKGSVSVPEWCPVLGIPVAVGPKRSANSPSLDRIVPSKGYIPTNVRVISDKANRLKGDCSLKELQRRAAESGPRQVEYGKTAAYLDRELLLQEVKAKAVTGGRAGAEWKKVADFLDRAFAKGPVD